MHDRLLFVVRWQQDGRVVRDAESYLDGRALRVATMKGDGALVDLIADELRGAVHRLAIPVVQRPPKGWRLFGRSAA